MSDHIVDQADFIWRLNRLRFVLETCLDLIDDVIDPAPGPFDWTVLATACRLPAGRRAIDALVELVEIAMPARRG